MPNMPIEGQVGPILRATLNDHIAKLDFLTWPDLKLEQLMTALFELDGRHDDQVDSLTQLDQVTLCKVLDFLKNKAKQKVVSKSNDGYDDKKCIITTLTF